MPDRRASRLRILLFVALGGVAVSVTTWLGMAQARRDQQRYEAATRAENAISTLDSMLTAMEDRRGVLVDDAAWSRALLAAWHADLARYSGYAAETRRTSSASAVPGARLDSLNEALQSLGDSVLRLFDAGQQPAAARLLGSGAFTRVEQRTRRAVGEYREAVRGAQSAQLRAADDRHLRTRLLTAWTAGLSLVLFLWALRRLRRERQQRLASQAEERERAAQMELALRAGQMGWWSLDLRDERMEWSPEVGPLYGRERGWVPGPGDLTSRIHVDDRERVVVERDRLFANGGGYLAPYRVVWPDGSVHWLDAEIMMETLPDGVSRRAMGVVRDVTSLQESNAARDAAGRRVAALIEGLGTGVVLYEGDDLTPTLMNTAARELLDVNDEGRADYAVGLRQIMPLDAKGNSVPLLETAPARARATGQPQRATYQIRRHNGTVSHAFVTAVPFNPEANEAAPSVLVSIVDVTALHALERTLELMSTASRYTTDMVFVSDVDGRIEWANDAARRRLGDGRALEEYPSAFRLLAVPSPTPGASSDPALATTVGTRQEVVVRVRLAPDAEWREEWLEVQVIPVRDARGVVTRLAWVAREITARREQELQLRDSEERFRAVVASMTEGLVVQDRHGAFVTWNARAAEMMGFTDDELAERNARDPAWYMEAEDGRPLAAHERPGAVAARERRPAVREVALPRPDGRRTWIRTSAAPLMRAGESEPWGVVLVLTDVTERRALEAQLRQTSKLQAVGTLAGGIAHDFNNLLTVIRGSAELLRAQHDAGANDNVAAIEAAAARGQTLTRQLLTFTRQNVEQPTAWSVDTLLRDTLQSLDIDSERAIVVDATLGAGSAMVAIDRPSFELALLNLVANARDASEPGGVVQVTSVQIGADDPTRPTPFESTVVRIDVRDAGSGFSSEALQHLFEPFFTSKGQAEGTGLGLATAYRVVQAAGGTMTVANEVGGGAVVSIWLPVVAESAAPPRSAVAAARDPRRSSAPATVLVVEDEDAVRQLAARALTRLGYAVRSAASGEEALALLLDSSSSIDIVLTDFAMPGMTGAELLARAAALGIEKPSVLMSGFTADETVRAQFGQFGTRFLAKPFSLTELADSLAGLLEK